MRLTKKIVILSVLFLCIGFATYAQIVLPGGNDPKGPSDVPIDGFIAFGLALGAALGFRKKFKK